MSVDDYSGTRQPISGTNGYATFKTAFESGSDATHYTLPSVDGVVAKAPSSGFDPSNYYFLFFQPH